MHDKRNYRAISILKKSIVMPIISMAKSKIKIMFDATNK